MSNHIEVVAKVPVQGVSTDRHEAVDGCIVTVLISEGAVQEAVKSGDYGALATAIGAAVAPELVYADDHVLADADRRGGESEDDDHAHLARKRRTLCAKIESDYAALKK